MSEAPTHAGVPTPTPARPQQNERTAQTERQADRTAQTVRNAEDRTPQNEQRTQHTDRMPQQQSQRNEQRTDAERTEQQRSDAQRSDAQRSDVQRTEAQRTEAQRNEAQRTDTPRSEQHAETNAAQRQSSKLEDEWQAVQYEFVDDPKAAVRKADGLVTRALEELTSRHRSLTKQLEGSSDPQTEDLRLALHRYRELFKSLVAVK